MPATFRALRGATTVDEDTEEQVTERVVTLLEAMFERNDVDHDDLVSIIFTATDDIHSCFPATAARTVLDDCALKGANDPALRTHWQPDPALTPAEALAELALVADSLTYLHVFT